MSLFTVYICWSVLLTMPFIYLYAYSCTARAGSGLERKETWQSHDWSHNQSFISGSLCIEERIGSKVKKRIEL
jgi:hypothetical protein